MPDQGIDALNLLNAGYVADIYEQYRRDPASVDPDWRSLFDSGTSGFEPVSAAPAPPTNGNQADAPAPRRAEAPPAPTTSVPEGATPIKGPAARLAQNMTASLGVPTATSFRDVDVAMLEARRGELNEQTAPRQVSLTHLLRWADVQEGAEQRCVSHVLTGADGRA